MKVSVSLDGKQATDLGQSKWITNSEVKQDVYHLRHTHDAVLTGNGTINADNPLSRLVFRMVKSNPNSVG